MCPKRPSSLFAILIAQCSVLALAGAGVPAAATPAGSGTPPGGFQLPSAPSPTATPQVQGPVDVEGPVPVAPRVIPTARPTPTPTPAPAPAQRPLPTILTPSPGPTETRRFTPAARATPGQRIAGEDTLSDSESAATPLDLTPAEPVLDSLPSPASLPSLADSDTGSPVQGTTSNSAGISNWWMWLAIVGALIAAGAALLVMRSRQRFAAAGAAPIEPPLVRQPSPPPRPVPAPAPAPKPAPLAKPVPAPEEAGSKPAAGKPIALEITPARLSRSMMNAMLSCGIKVHNGTSQDIRNLQISGDLVTAHSRVPISDQLADTATELAPLDMMTSVGAGETGEISINLNLPIRQIRPITQGRATLYVPLLRLRVSSEGHDTITQTFVIGMKPPGSDKVQPFRLDEMPQTYSQIGSRALD